MTRSSAARAVSLALLPCAALMCAACATAQRSAATDHRAYTTVNALGAFWAFWDAARGEALSRQVELFRSTVVRAHPLLFKENVVGRSAGTEPFSLDSRLGEWLPDLPRRIAIMRRLTREIESSLRSFDESFRRAFPSFAWRGKVYFTVSLDAFDGSVRKVDKELALLFGIDKIAKLHGAGASLEPLFHHELFHLHHGAISPQPEDDRTLLYPLWNEGLAVFVAQKLNPHASWQQLVLSDEMVRRGAEQLPRLACELRPHLKGTTEAAFRDFFLGAGKRSDIPNRVGYYVGLRVVQETARDRSLEELVRLRGKELFTAVDAALAHLARGQCPSRVEQPSGRRDLQPLGAAVVPRPALDSCRGRRDMWRPQPS